MTFCHEKIRKMKIKTGLLGFGNVGQGVWNYLAKSSDPEIEEYEIVAIGIRNTKNPRSIASSEKQKLPKFTSEPLEDIIENPEIKIVVNTIGGNEEYDKISLQLTQRALEKGKHVVMCNKNNLSTHLEQLTSLANENRANLRYGACVGGGVPIINNIQGYLGSDEIISLKCILNGTSNYILTQMHAGKSFREAIEESQDLGYAETDPARDISGADASEKLALLASFAFKTIIKPCDITLVEGIQDINKDDIHAVKVEISRKFDQEYIIKPLAIAKRSEDGLELRVHPAYISKNHPLAGVHGVKNAVLVECRYSGQHLFIGNGAGSQPTGYAVAMDIFQIGRNLKKDAIENFSSFNQKYGLAETCRTEGYIISTSPADEVGVFEKKIRAIASHRINIEDIQNFPRKLAVGSEMLLPDIFILTEVDERRTMEAANEITKLECVRGKARYIRADYVSEDRIRQAQEQFSIKPEPS